MRFALIAVAAATSILSACAPASHAVDGDAVASTTARCFRTESIRNFRADSRSDLYVRSNRDDVFHISTNGGCWDLDTAYSVAILPPLGGTNTICVGDMVRIVVPNTSPARGVCRATVAKSLTAEEVAALPDGSRP